MAKIFNIKFSRQLNAIGSVAVVNVILAFIALFKDILLASYLGTTLYSDAFMLAFFITDMLGNNLIAQAVGTGSIPIFSKIYVKEHKYALRRCVFKLIGASLIATIFLSCILYLLRNEIIYFLAVGFSEEALKLCIMLFAVLIPTIAIYPITAILISLIQVHGKFTFAASIPVIFNLIFSMGAAYCYFNNVEKIKGVFIISYTILLSLGVILFLTLYFERKLYKTKIEKVIKASDNNRDITDIIRLSIPFLLIILLSQAILYFERSVASGFGTGNISGLNYAYRLSQFPIWVFVAAISAVFFPSISKLIGIGNRKKAKENLLKVIWIIVVFIIPLMLLMFILRTPIISVLFLRNAFDSNSLSITEKIFSTYCLAILGQSITYICIKYFLALKTVALPLKVLFLTTFINFIIDIYASKYIGLYSFGIGAAVSSIVSALILLNYLEINIILILKKYKTKFFKILLSNMLLAALLIFSHILWNSTYYYLSFFYRFLFVAVTTILWGLIYLSMLYKFKIIDKGDLFWLQDL